MVGDKMEDINDTRLPSSDRMRAVAFVFKNGGFKLLANI